MHVQNTARHTFGLEGVQILGGDNNKCVRKSLEDIHTFKKSDTLDRAWEVYPI